MLVIIILSVLGVVGLGYTIALWCQAQSHMDTAPKRDMVICEKHGAFHAEAAIDINAPGLEIMTTTGEKTRGVFPYCPRCFEDRIREAKAHYGNKD